MFQPKINNRMFITAKITRITCIGLVLLNFLSVVQACCQTHLILGPKSSIFAPGIISTEDGEFAPTFTADEKTVYFTGGPMFIYRSDYRNNKWSKPEVVTFSGKWKDMDPFLSPDGKRLYFSSYRPVDDTSTNPLKYAHIWFTQLVSGKWSAPHHLPAPVNLPGVNNYAPAISKNGTLFFFSPNRNTQIKSSYSSEWLGEHYDIPKLVPIKGEGGIHDPYISANEHYLVFVSGGDVYISFYESGIWSERQKLGAQVNNGGKNSSPYVSPTGKTLYYSSDKANGILMVAFQVQ